MNYWNKCNNFWLHFWTYTCIFNRFLIEILRLLETIGTYWPCWPLLAPMVCPCIALTLAFPFGLRHRHHHHHHAAKPSFRPPSRAYHVIGVPTSQYGLRASARLGWGSFSTKATQGIKCDICLSDMFHTLAARVPGASGNFKSINDCTLAARVPGASGNFKSINEYTLAEASGQKQNTLAEASGIVSVW